MGPDTGESLPTHNQAMPPNAPKTPNMVRAVLQSVSSAKGTALATDTATPRLKNTVLKEFIMSAPRAENHPISRGPVVVTIRANPTPNASLKASMEKEARGKKRQG